MYKYSGLVPGAFSFKCTWKKSNTITLALVKLPVNFVRHWVGERPAIGELVMTVQRLKEWAKAMTRGEKTSCFFQSSVSHVPNCSARRCLIAAWSIQWRHSSLVQVLMLKNMDSAECTRSSPHVKQMWEVKQYLQASVYRTASCTKPSPYANAPGPGQKHFCMKCY